MRQVSTDYAPFSTVRTVDLQLSFAVKDENAKKENARAEAGDRGVFDNLDATLDSVNQPDRGYLTLEKNMWKLSGDMAALPDGGEARTGFWSRTISNEEGTFAEPFWVQYTFPVAISTIGWVLRFDARANQYPTRVRVTLFDGDGNTLDAVEFENDGPTLEMQHFTSGYSTVQFAFLSTNEPGRRLRLMEVDFGLVKNYDRNSIGTARILYGADILCRSLPSRELSFTFDNADKKYNLLNPDGLYSHLQDGQQITAVMEVNGKRVDMGSFYFSSADADGSGIAPRIVAHDKIYELDNGTYEGADGGERTLQEAVETVLGDFPLSIHFADDCGSRAVTLSMNDGVTLRECIRLLAQAAMCTAYVDRDGVLQFCSLSAAESEDSAITADELYNYSGVSVADRVDGVKLYVSGDRVLNEEGNVTRYTFTAGDTGPTARTVAFFNPCVAPANGEAVAAWYLAGLQRRKCYRVKNRCDPAVEIGDTLRISDIFDNRENAVVTGLEICFDGSLYTITEGVGA